MKVVRATIAACAAACLVALGSFPAVATSWPAPTDTFIAEGRGLSFALRPSYDAGGAAPLHLYVGYADANLLAPPTQADGQASWYNFNIAETAAFKPADECIPRNDPDSDADGTPDAIEDAQAYITDYVTSVIGRAQDGTQPPPPTVPAFRGLCSERLSGFAQSRFPATYTIGERADDNYFDKPAAASACRDAPDSQQCSAYKQYWPQFSDAVRGFVRDGSFHAEAKPGSQRSESLLMGAGDGIVVSIGLARNVTEATVGNGGAATVTSRALLDDVCIGVTATGCTLGIDHIEQVARVVAGRTPSKESHTTIVGVHGAAGDRQVTASDLKLEQGSIDFGGYFGIQAVSKTHGCDADDTGFVTADAGGFRIYGSGGAGQAGGSIMIGGACASARWQKVAYTTPIDNGGNGIPYTPPQTLSFPGQPPVPGVAGKPVLGAPRIVTRTVLHPEYQRAIAWRTAPWWGTFVGLLLVAGVLLRVFRDSALAAPVVRGIDRFARQFIRG